MHDVQTIMNPTPQQTGGETITCLVNASCTAMDDKVLAFGGFHFYNDDVFNDLYLLTMEDMIWKKINHIKGPWPCKRCDHTATLWHDKLVIFGGKDANDAFLNDLYILHVSTLTWEKPNIRGEAPSGRGKHSAVIEDNKLYIYGGWCSTDGVAGELNILNLETMEWQVPIPVIPRHSHFCTIYKSRLYIYGGMSATLDPGSDLLILDLDDFVQTTVTVSGKETPSTLGQHFVQLCGDKLIVLITRSLNLGGDRGLLVSNDENEVLTGIWSLNLDSMRWRRHDDGRYLGSGSWHYYAMAKDQSKLLLLGSGGQEASSEEYMGTVLDLDLEVHGLFKVPESRMGSDFGPLLPFGDDDDLVPVASNNASNAARNPSGPTSVAADARGNHHVEGLVYADSPCSRGSEDGLGRDVGKAGAHYHHHRPSISTAQASAALALAIQSADLEVLCRDRNAPAIKVHRLVLLARWPHFAAMERSGMSECEAGRIRILEPYATVKAFIRYVYTDSVERIASTSTVADLLVMGDLYCMERLKKLCSVRLHRELSIDTAAVAFAKAHAAGERGLKARAFRFVLDHFGAVARTEGFRRLMRGGSVENGGLGDGCEGAQEELWDCVPYRASVVVLNDRVGLNGMQRLDNGGDGMALSERDVDAVGGVTDADATDAEADADADADG
ncbi:hypothetical protein HDU76_003040 [Blyttiomyces sp. JEL0837]|nr:hypothetical protein HDU76_003040 [Blyttiomyces sp. JEL0837]